MSVVAAAGLSAFEVDHGAGTAVRTGPARRSTARQDGQAGACWVSVAHGGCMLRGARLRLRGSGVHYSTSTWCRAATACCIEDDVTAEGTVTSPAAQRLRRWHWLHRPTCNGPAVGAALCSNTHSQPGCVLSAQPAGAAGCLPSPHACSCVSSARQAGLTAYLVRGGVDGVCAARALVHSRLPVVEVPVCR